MLLFDVHSTNNCLPYDGEVLYYGQVFPVKEADTFLHLLTNTIAWRHDEIRVFGKHRITSRKVAWYADAAFSYTYSGITKQALLWTKELLELKRKAEELTGFTYNSCLLNLYHHGNEGMGYHSDDEISLKKNAAIASFSFGAERKFLFKHKQHKKTVSCLLEHGSLLVMTGATQTHWQHSLPKSARVHHPRINLTFRTMDTRHS